MGCNRAEFSYGEDCMRGLAYPLTEARRLHCSVTLARMVFMAAAMFVQQRCLALDYALIARAVQSACIYLCHFVHHLLMPILDPTRGQRQISASNCEI